MAKKETVKMIAIHTIQQHDEMGDLKFTAPGKAFEIDADEGKRMFLRGAASYENDQETQAKTAAAVELPPETDEQREAREASEKDAAQKLEAEKAEAAKAGSNKGAGVKVGKDAKSAK